jgi:hypothetical protein
MYLNAVDLAKLPASHTPNGRTINELETLWKEAAKIISSTVEPHYNGPYYNGRRL